MGYSNYGFYKNRVAISKDDWVFFLEDGLTRRELRKAMRYAVIEYRKGNRAIRRGLRYKLKKTHKNRNKWRNNK